MTRELYSSSRGNAAMEHIMRHEGEYEEVSMAREQAAQEKMRRAVLCAFCHIVQTTGLRPMAVLGLAATAVGSIYKDMAAAHLHAQACPCGWQPQANEDIEALQRAIETEAAPRADLRWLKVAGKA
jgi:hypothetical protein